MAAIVTGGDSPIYEGFLCPMCLQNFDTVYKLQSHVENAHGTEEKAAIRNVKNFFGKAKRFITNRPDEEEQLHEREYTRGDSTDGSPTKQRLQGTDPFTWDSQEFGACRSHFDSLRRIRSDRIDRTVVEINKLVIRLEKLIKKGPPLSDNAKRKEYERTVVPWAEDSDVRFCPFCADKFSLAVRRHHCRLCGSIMCNKCSLFVGIPFCEQVLDPDSKGSLEKKESEPSKKTEVTLRVCSHCDNIMTKRLKMAREKTSKPLIVQLYKKMMELREQILNQLPVYEKTALSILNGEEEYSYDRADKERTLLLKYFDALDQLSKKILTLGSSSGGQLSTTQLRLRKHIRAEAIRFLQENMLGLRQLPSQEEVLKLQAARRAAIARRLEEERQARAARMQAEAQALERSALERAAKKAVEESKMDGSPGRYESASKGSPKRGHERTGSWSLLNKIREQAQEVGAGMMGGLAMGSSDARMVVPPSGWKPSAVSQESVQALSDDPLIQQMNIISSYLNQAQEAGRWDEVNMLEANLKDLQLEYRQKHSGRTEY